MKTTVTILALFFSLFSLPLLFAHGATQGVMEMDIQGTHHIEAIVQTLDGQAIPDMQVTVTIQNQQTGQTRTAIMHPMFSAEYHYGSNVDLPEGNYVMTWHLDPPTFMRGAQRENMWTHPVEFTNTFDSTIDTADGVTLGTLTTTDMHIVFEAWPAKSMFVTEGAHGDMEAMEEEDHNQVMVAPRTSRFYWQTWMALIIGLLAGAVSIFALIKDRQ